MKRFMVWMFGLMATLATTLAFANATAYSVSGNVTAQTGAAAPRLVRQGDTLRAGDTVITGAASSAVLRFEDGQIAALSANSRMLIQASDYNAQAKTGNIVLNLLSGGMRAITGLIGRNLAEQGHLQGGQLHHRHPRHGREHRDRRRQRGGDGERRHHPFTVGSQTYTVTAGKARSSRADGTVRMGVIATIVQQVQARRRSSAPACRRFGSVPFALLVPSTGTGTPGRRPPPAVRERSPRARAHRLARVVAERPAADKQDVGMGTVLRNRPHFLFCETGSGYFA